MDTQSFIILYKELLANEELMQKELAEMLGTSSQSLKQKIRRGTMPFIEFVNLAGKLGYRIVLEKDNPADPNHPIKIRERIIQNTALKLDTDENPYLKQSILRGQG